MNQAAVKIRFFSQDMIKNRENVSIFIIYFLEKLLLIFKTATARDWSENFELMHVNVCVLHVVKK